MEIVTPQPLEKTDSELADLLKWFVNDYTPARQEEAALLDQKKSAPYNVCQCGSGLKAKFCKCVVPDLVNHPRVIE
jgi:hypothetical protein